MTDLTSAKQFQFVGGNLSLDFCNTMGGKRGATTHDHLASPLAYVAWAFQAGLVDRQQAQRFLRKAEKHTEESEAVLRRAVQFRETLFRIFGAIIEAKEPARPDLALLNAELARALGRLRVTRSSTDDGYAWEWERQGEDLAQPLGQIAHEAAKLLTDNHALAHLRICNGDNCGWLFVDSSKNHSRRWCDMRDCGNRAKIRRHRQKRNHAGRD